MPERNRAHARVPGLSSLIWLQRSLVLLAALACTVTETIPADEPIDEPVDEPIDEPVDEPIDEPVDEPIDEPAQGGSGGMAGTGGMSGSGGAPVVEPPRSDVIEVDDGDFTPGPPPPPASEGTLAQIVSVVGPPAVTNGGSAILHVQLSAPVTAPRFVVGLNEDSGYHTVTGVDPDGDGTYDITTVVAAGATQTSLTFRVALTDGSGAVGAYTQLAIPVIQSGTGDVKITLSWDRLHDLDLRVVEPSGEVIRYSNQSSGTGGTLDLDSGANCGASTANSENIFWPAGGGPTGQYVVSVHNYQQCTAGPIDYTVRIVYDNVVSTYKGTFLEGTASDQDTAGSLREITTFFR